MRALRSFSSRSILLTSSRGAPRGDRVFFLSDVSPVPLPSLGVKYGVGGFVRPLTGGAGDAAPDDIPGDVVVESRAITFPDSAGDEDASSFIVTVYGLRSQAVALRLIT